MSIQVRKQANPPNPPDGMQGLFPNADGQWESVDSQGNRTPLAQGDGGAEPELELAFLEFKFNTNEQGLTQLAVFGRFELTFVLPYTPVGKAVISFYNLSHPGFNFANNAMYISSFVAGYAIHTNVGSLYATAQAMQSAEICDNYAKARRLTYSPGAAGGETTGPSGPVLTKMGQLYAGALFGWYNFGGAASFPSTTSDSRILIESAWIVGNRLHVAIHSGNNNVKQLDGSICLAYARDPNVV